MNNYRFILDKKSKKFICPECSKRTFTRYFDNITGKYLPDNYGRCDREIKCTYHLNPYRDGYAKMIWEQEKKSVLNFEKKPLTPYIPQMKQEINVPSFIPHSILEATIKEYERNTFIQNLLKQIKFPFHKKDVFKVIEMYLLGTISKGYRTGAITFPFIDINGNVRAIQAKQFDESNHTISTDFLHSIYKRDCEKYKKSFPHWLVRYLENEKIISCLFGEHLLTEYPGNPVALVEAPKTAIINTLYFGLPDTPKNFLWLAVYNVSSLTIEKIKILQGRKVVLFPDLGAFEKWSNKAKQFENEMTGTVFLISDLIESLASNESKKKGEDIADFLTRMDWREFKKYNKS